MPAGPSQRLEGLAETGTISTIGFLTAAALRAAVPTGGLYPSDFVFWALRCERHRRALLHQPVSRSAGSNQPEARVSNTYAGLCLDGSWP